MRAYDERDQFEPSENSDSSVSPPTKRRPRFILAPLIIALIFMAVQYFGASTYTNPETGKTVRVALSPEQEEALGLQSFNEITSQSDLVTSGPEYDQVQRVVKRLIKGVDQSSQNFEWAVSVIRGDEVNAFCLPGGKIAVYTGILPVAQNDAGLAAVIGHEIAHATLHHGAQRMLQQQLVQTGLQGVNGSFSDYDYNQRRLIMGVLGAGAQFGLVLPYGRNHELEADRMGLVYLARAGYDPEEAVRFWERMDATGSSQQPPEWASTHPSHGSRIQRLKEIIASGTLPAS